MSSNLTFFTPTDVLNINTLLNLTDEGAAKWIIQTANPVKTKERASGLGATGDEAAYKEHNTKDALSIVYKCFAATGNLTLPTVGAIAGTYHIDNVSLAYSPTDWPTLTVSCHKHSDGTTHTTCREYSPSCVFPAQFGVPASISDTASAVQFSMDAATIGMRSLSYSLTCTHVDETGSVGNFLGGENHDGVETLDAEFTGQPDDIDLTVGAAWSRTNDNTAEGNTAVNTRSISITKHIAADA